MQTSQKTTQKLNLHLFQVPMHLVLPLQCQSCHRPPQAKPQVSLCTFALICMVILVKTFYPGSQLQSQSQASRQGSQQTEAKCISANGVSKATEIPTVPPTAHKRGSSESEASKAKVHVAMYAREVTYRSCIMKCCLSISRGVKMHLML